MAMRYLALIIFSTIVFAAISGSGSSFVYPYIQLVIKYKHLPVNYQAVGSGAGQANWVNKLTDFAASDVPLVMNFWEKVKGQYVVHVPIIAGGVAVVFNLPGIRELKLSCEVLANIYLGKIRYWDDPAIRSLNPDAPLPHKPIIAVHRSDASGTTALFTKYLSKCSKEWARRVGSNLVVRWPVDYMGTGIGAPKNQGVAATVARTPYSIGYVELAYTKGLKVAAISNAEGNFVLPTAETISKATEEASKYFTCILCYPDKFVDALIMAPGKDSYPIVGVPFLIFSLKEAKAYQIINFAKALLDPEMQKIAIKLGYAPLAEAFREKVLCELNLAELAVK